MDTWTDEKTSTKKKERNLYSKDGTGQRMNPTVNLRGSFGNSIDLKKPAQSHVSCKLYSLMWCAALGQKHPAEINSSVMKKSMRRPLSSQFQSVQALLPTQSMLRADFVGRLCSCDVNLGVFGGTFSCHNTQKRFLY